MLNKKLIVCLILFLQCTVHASLSYAQTGDGIGQTIQIYTRFHSFVGQPSWLLIIRDVDHGQNIPYLFDIKKGDNMWVAMTFSRNYLITVSSLQFSPYRMYPNRNYPRTYSSAKINNFCGLESNGSIIRDESLYIVLSGDLTPNRDRFTCHVSRYKDMNFTTGSP